MENSVDEARTEREFTLPAGFLVKIGGRPFFLNEETVVSGFDEPQWTASAESVSDLLDGCAVHLTSALEVATENMKSAMEEMKRLVHPKPAII